MTSYMSGALDELFLNRTYFIVDHQLFMLVGLTIVRYDFLEIIRMIVINIRTSPFLPKHTFGQTFLLIGPNNGLI